MQSRALVPDRIDQCSEMIGIYIGRDAVAKVEYVSGTRTKTGECFTDLPADHLGIREQNGGIEISLQRNLIADAFAGLRQGDRPVNTERITAGRRQGFQLRVAPLAEQDHRHLYTLDLDAQARDDPLHVRQ